MTVPRVWSLVLAGGEGVRLRPLARLICGRDRPKQFVPLLGPHTLLRETLDRVAPLAPPARTVVVGRESHADLLATELLADPAPPHVLRQPADRGTAAAILLGAGWIAAREPGAVVAVFPSDHFVLEADRFVAHVAAVAGRVTADPEHLVLLGARPTSPDTGYGWVQPGAPLGWDPTLGVHRVACFVEKPPEAVAVAGLVEGWLWNTFVMVATARALLEAGRAFLPAMHARLGRLAAFFGGEHERWATEQAYALLAPASFSREVLERGPAGLTVSTLPPLAWSDLGTPGRVLDVVKATGVVPAWVRAGAATG